LEKKLFLPFQIDLLVPLYSLPQNDLLVVCCDVGRRRLVVVSKTTGENLN